MKNRFDIIKNNILPYGAGITCALLISWLFYDFEPMSVIGLTSIPIVAADIKKRISESQAIRTNTAFKDGLAFMKNALDAGYSPERSLAFAAESMEKLYGKGEYMTAEFARMCAEMSVGYPMEKAFAGLGERSALKEVMAFADTFSVLKRTGGNLNKVIMRTVTNLKEKLSLRRELHVAVAQAETEFEIMSAVPFGILIYLRLCAPDLIGPLYHNAFGKLFMTGCLVVCEGAYVVGSTLIRKTLSVKK